MHAEGPLHKFTSSVDIASDHSSPFLTHSLLTPLFRVSFLLISCPHLVVFLGCSYLTSGAEYCDDMLCDKMVLRFQGGFYLSGARSYQKSSLYNTAKDQWCGPPIPTDGFLDRRNAGSSNTTREVYTGVALLASGTVSLTSLRKEVEYPVGHMDYVYDFLNIADADIGNIQTRYGLAAGDYPFLTPNTYKMKLVGEKKATYKK